jgi:glycosyltransferase involved in cell wall biosynthesis
VNPAADPVFDTGVPISGRRGIAFMGSWISRKGTGVTIAALSRLLSARPELRFSVIGAGRSSAAVHADFDASLRARISVLEWGSPSELAAAVSEAAILLFPTRYEGFGLVVLEAMLAGAAVVTTATGAGVDAVRDGESGLVVGVDDQHAAESALARLLDDDALRQRLAEAGRAEARRRSWRRSAEELLVCYESALRFQRGARTA